MAATATLLTICNHVYLFNALAILISPKPYIGATHPHYHPGEFLARPNDLAS